MTTLSLKQPEENWYMDTEIASHMTTTLGTLTSYSNLSQNEGIIVDNSSMIPIRGYGNASLIHTNPLLKLTNVLHDLKLIKNLISVCKLTINNNPMTVLNDPNWKNAILDKYKALINNKMWDLVPHPSYVNIIRSLWIFVINRNLIVLLRGIKPVL